MGVSFTNGPWTATESLDHKYMSSVDAGARCIALVGASDVDEQNANALLIAAAPDLFYYLKLELGVIDRAGIVWMGEEAARKALAKARGEQVPA